jgi:hypothetical protein
LDHPIQKIPSIRDWIQTDFGEKKYCVDHHHRRQQEHPSMLLLAKE